MRRENMKAVFLYIFYNMIPPGVGFWDAGGQLTVTPKTFEVVDFADKEVQKKGDDAIGSQLPNETKDKTAQRLLALARETVQDHLEQDRGDK